MNLKSTFTILMQQRLFMLLACCLALINMATEAFAQTTQTTGPGGVTSGLRIWLKPEVGFSPSSWTDQSLAGSTYTQTNTNRQPFANTFSRATNFHPTINFGGDTDTDYRFMVVPTGKPFSGNGLSGSIFMMIQRHTIESGWQDYLGFGGTSTGTTGPQANSPVFTNYSGYPGETSLYPNGATTLTNMRAVANQLFINDVKWSVGVAGSIRLGLDGRNASLAGTQTTTETLTANGSVLGGQAGVDQAANSDFGDVIAYERDLTNEERDRVRSYLAIKYGITLLQAQNYFASNGTVVWNSDISVEAQAYNNNIFGVARDDASTLDQRISNSIKGTQSLLMVATTNNFTLANNAVGRTKIATDKSFLLFGDNNNATTAVRNLTSSDCPAIDPNANVKRIERVWLVQKTGTPGGVYLNFDYTPFAINTKVFMLVADDANFTQNVQKISGTYRAGKGTFTYDFPANKYITFGGEYDASVCPSCEGGSFKIDNRDKWWSTRTPSTGDSWDLNQVGPYVAATPTSGAINATLKILDPDNVEFVPQYRPWVYGDKRLWLERWPNSPALMTYQVNLSSSTTAAAQAKVRFKISGINKENGTSDVVTVVGFCNGTQVTPTIGYASADKALRTYTINNNVLTGTNWWGFADNYGTANVEFTTPVDRIEIRWKHDNGRSYRTHKADLLIGEMSFECPAPLPPNADAIYVEQRFDNNEIATCSKATMELKITNENCDPRVINLTDVLPSALSYIPNSYNDSDMPAGTIQPVYSGQNFSLTGLTVPPGVHKVYVGVKPTNATSTGTFPTQGNYTVVSSGKSYSTIGDTGDFGTTSMTIKAGTPVMTPDTMTMAVNKTCFAVGDTLTYTVSFNNTKGVQIPKVDFTNFVDSTKVRILAGSLNTTFGGVANSYAGATLLSISDMTLPIGGSSLSYKVVVLAAAATSDTLINQASVVIDPTSECGGDNAALKTAPLSLVKCANCAKPTGLGINGSSSQTQLFCANSTITLQATCPSGSTTTWYKIGTSNVKIGTGSPLTQTFTETTTYGATCEKEGCLALFDNTNKITATAHPIVAAATNTVSSAGTTAICVGASTNLSATCATGTTVVWYIGTAVAATGSPVAVSPTTTTTYTAKCKSTATSCESATTSANDVVVTVNPVVPVPTGISSSKGTSGLCVGDSTSLSATCASGSSAVWYIGTAVAGTGSPLVVKPTSTTTYTAKCKTTDTACESASTSAQDLTITVLPVVANPTGISSSAGTTICAGTSTNISATCASGSSVVWYSSGAVVATGSPLNITPSANVTYTAKCKSNATSCESASTSAQDLSIIVTPIPTAPTGVTAANSTICPNGSTTVSGTCATGTIQWYIGTTLVGSGSPLAVSPLATTIYRATCKSSVGTCESAQTTSAEVTVTVGTPAAPTGITSSAGTSLCTNNTSTNLTANCVSGSAVKWYIGTVFIGTGSTLPVSPLATTTYTATCQSITGTCESAPATITIEVSSCVVPAPVVSSNPNPVVAGQSTTFTATGCSGTISWYKNGVLISGANNSTYGPIIPAEGDKYTSKCTVNNIDSPSSNEITVPPATPTVTPNPNPVIPGQSATYTVTGCSGTISWYKNGVLISGVTSNPYVVNPTVSGDSYTAVCTVNGVPSSPSTPVVVPPAAPTVTSNPNPVIPGQPTTFTVTGCSGTISWYKNGVLISGANNSTYGPITAVSGDSYTSVCTVNGIPSSPSTPVVVPALTEGLIAAKVFLSGALGTSTTAMTTTLNSLNLIPTTDPYGKNTTTTYAVLTAYSITDWVLVELRSAPSIVTESIAALVSSDGTLRNADGTTPLKFATTSGNYYLSVRHRNHLGVMTANPIAVSTTAQTIDFTNAATATYGTNAQKTGAVNAMWAGNATGINSTNPEKVIYAGSGTDVGAVRLIALSIGTLGTSSVVAGYRNSDLNLDGKTIYAGANNDSVLIRATVLGYLTNTLGTAGIVNQNF